ncbi:MAG: class IV adenylate cyclase [Candidatus Pacebacteria bacterium]|nr:class IV adenylate cyclase [Candidatus Paceibacterota bacterium]
MTKLFINYVKSGFDIPKEEKDLLNKTIKKHALAAGRLLNIPYVTITVYPKPSWAMPETGEGGYTPSGDWIQIYIDPKNKKCGLKNIIEKYLPANIYHEMNHIARWRSIGYGNTLLETIVSEGIASVFEKEQWKAFVAPWAKFNEKEISDFLKIIRKRDEGKGGSYNHAEWFYGKGILPKWIGYKLGVYIVESFRNNFPGTSWQELTEMKANEIIKKSGAEGKYFYASLMDSNQGEEIEIKVKINRSEADSIRKKLLMLGAILKEKKKEKDAYFTSAYEDFIKSKICLRIRQKDDALELTYKGPTTKDMDNKKQFWKPEFNILLKSSKEEAESLLQALNFIKVAEVIKERETYDLGNQKITIDNVENAGWFVEIEGINIKKSDREMALDKNMNLLSRLGLKETNIINEPYRDIVLFNQEKNNNKK